LKDHLHASQTDKDEYIVDDVLLMRLQIVLLMRYGNSKRVEQEKRGVV